MERKRAINGKAHEDRVALTGPRLGASWGKARVDCCHLDRTGRVDLLSPRLQV